jgi:hypothetical protein
MKVDWEEHYSDWSDDEAEGGVDFTMSEPGSPSDYYGFPVGADEPDLWVNQTDDPLEDGETTSRDLFMDNTSLEAYPDGDDDGVQDDFMDSNVCTDDDPLADVPDNIDPTQFNRTNNADTYDDDAGEPLPLINLDDVKPGDFGEVTFSFHLCTNPGYVWMNADNVTAAENGVTEPEADDPDEDQVEGEGNPALKQEEEGDKTVELLDEIQTALWYDQNCNNLIDGGDGGGGELCVQLVLDSSGSMSNTDGDDETRNAELISGAKTLASNILDENEDNRVGVVDFDGDADLVLSVADDEDGLFGEDENGTPDSQEIDQVESAIDTINTNGSTNIGAGIDTADEDLANCPSGAQTVQIVVTDGQGSVGTSPDDAVGDDGNTDEIFAVGTGGATEDTLMTFARPSNDSHVFLTEGEDTFEDVLSELGGELLSGEKVLFEGSLRDALLALTEDNGVPLSPPSESDFDETADPDDAAARECFMGETTQCIGFSWWLPLDHGNEVQSDSVGFDLGFYTEQCRHNTGSGMNNENVDPDEIDA